MLLNALTEAHTSDKKPKIKRYRGQNSFFQMTCNFLILEIATETVKFQKALRRVVLGKFFDLHAENGDLTITRPKVRDLKIKFLDKVLFRSLGV